MWRATPVLRCDTGHWRIPQPVPHAAAAYSSGSRRTRPGSLPPACPDGRTMRADARPPPAGGGRARPGDGPGSTEVSSGHLLDVQVRVGEVELVHLDDLAARIVRGPASHLVVLRAASFHRGAGLPGRGGAAQAG